MVRHKIPYLVVVGLACQILLTSVCRAAINPKDITIPDNFAKNYVFSFLSANQPVQISKEELKQHNNTLGFAYQHRLGLPWLVSVGYRSQSFINKSTRNPLSLMTFSNSTQRIFRLYHPLYFMAGTELMYLIPVRKINPPITKDPDFSTEIGVGLRGTLWLYLSRNFVATLDFQRWRGTNTERLQGQSFSIGLGFGF